jgi:hypothetical protein
MVVDSNQQKLSSMDVIKIAAENTKSKRPLKQVYEMLKIEFSQPKVWKMQEGNTIFIIHRTKVPGHGFFRALNADSPRMFLQNSQVFMRAAYKAGFDVVVTQFEDPTILNIFKIIGRAQPAGMGYATAKTQNDGYQVVLRLGPSRKAGDQ